LLILWITNAWAGQETRERAAGKIWLRRWYAQIATDFPSKEFVDFRVPGHGGTPI
jgi:hypothetical protein